MVAAVDTDAAVDTARGQRLVSSVRGPDRAPEPEPRPKTTPPAPRATRLPSRWRRRLLIGAGLGAAGATAAVLLARRGEIHDVLDPPLEVVKLALVDTSRAVPVRADLAIELPARHRVKSSSPHETTYEMSHDGAVELGLATLQVSLSAEWHGAQSVVDRHMTHGEEIVDVGPWPPSATSYIVTYRSRLGSRVGIEVEQAGAHGGAVTCTAEMVQNAMPRKRTVGDLLPRLRALCAFVPE